MFVGQVLIWLIGCLIFWYDCEKCGKCNRLIYINLLKSDKVIHFLFWYCSPCCQLEIPANLQQMVIIILYFSPFSFLYFSPILFYFFSLFYFTFFIWFQNSSCSTFHSQCWTSVQKKWAITKQKLGFHRHIDVPPKTFWVWMFDWLNKINHWLNDRLIM